MNPYHVGFEHRIIYLVERIGLWLLIALPWWLLLSSMSYATPSVEKYLQSSAFDYPVPGPSGIELH